MDLLIMLAAKSLLIAGGVLLLLKLADKRSAADRSLIAHLGLAAILLLPLAALALPALEVQGPSFLAAEPQAAVVAPSPPAAATDAAVTEAAAPAATFPGDQAVVSAPVDWAFWGYVLPAGLLLLLTLIALGRLFALKARATVLVDTHWLSALAHAQRRMGFKHGTALLTSDDLPSPISWGLMRPVILLNSDATKSKHEAEAIIAHELAHVANLDWVKLLLARVTVALFWFNPLVWILSREAHQLREEAADDAVLQSDIEDTDYANLLVGVARHECRGLLIGAHGVAPGKHSLTRRVRRVLDSALARAPGGWRWTSAAAFFAAGMAVPLATLHFVPTSPASAAGIASVGGKARTAAAEDSVAPALLASDGGAIPDAPAPVGPVAPVAAEVAQAARTIMTHPNGGTITVSDKGTVVRSPDGGSITIAPPDANGRQRTVMTQPNGAQIAFADARAVPGLASATAVAGGAGPGNAIDRAIERKAVGATPDYVRSIRNAAPNLRLDHDEIVQLAALGVTPAYLRELASSGYPGLNADHIVEAKVMGVTGRYIRDISAIYGRVSMDRLVELRALGVTARDITRYRDAAGKLPSIHKIVELKALGIDPEDLDDSP